MIPMKVLFCANLPSPYRVDFFNEFGKVCDLTVCYERKNASDRDEKWKGSGAQNYKEVFLDLKPKGADQSYGSALRKYIAAYPCDRLILTNYISPACMEAIIYCKAKRIPYWLEWDGGFNKQDPVWRRALKRFLLGSAAGHLTTSEEHIKYLTDLGIKRDRIYKYPFTSISEKDVLPAPLNMREKDALRRKLGIAEPKVIVSVGRFNYNNGEGKGFDLLFRIAEELDDDTGIYIIGDEPTDRFKTWKKEKDLRHVHFVPFKVKQDLFEYYRAADLMVLLTRGDVWGLVVNEAMANGLPVITTERCIAGTEMVHNGENGYIVPANSYKEAEECISRYFAFDSLQSKMQEQCIVTVEEFTIEKMARRHYDILSGVL